MYLGYWAEEVYPRPLEDDGLCGECGRRPASWGDWLCSQCRQELESRLEEALADDTVQNAPERPQEAPGAAFSAE